MSYLEAGRKSENRESRECVRLEVQLMKSTYNIINYRNSVNALKADISWTPLGISEENTFDRFKDYEEESYIDNSEAFPDSYPVGLEPECEGFFVNRGTLILKSSLKVHDEIVVNPGKLKLKPASKEIHKKLSTAQDDVLVNPKKLKLKCVLEETKQKLSVTQDDVLLIKQKKLKLKSRFKEIQEKVPATQDEVFINKEPSIQEDVLNLVKEKKLKLKSRFKETHEKLPAIQNEVFINKEPATQDDVLNLVKEKKLKLKSRFKETQEKLPATQDVTFINEEKLKSTFEKKRKKLPTTEDGSLNFVKSRKITLKPVFTETQKKLSTTEDKVFNVINPGKLISKSAIVRAQEKLPMTQDGVLNGVNTGKLKVKNTVAETQQNFPPTQNRVLYFVDQGNIKFASEFHGTQKILPAVQNPVRQKESNKKFRKDRDHRSLVACDHEDSIAHDKNSQNASHCKKFRDTTPKIKKPRKKPSKMNADAKLDNILMVLLKQVHSTGGKFCSKPRIDNRNPLKQSEGQSSTYFSLSKSCETNSQNEATLTLNSAANSAAIDSITTFT